MTILEIEAEVDPQVSVPDEDEQEMLEIWLSGDWPGEMCDDRQARG